MRQNRMRLADVPAELNELAERVIGAAIEVHRELGPGLLERLYEEALCHELSLRGIACERQVPIAIHYKELLLSGQRLDLIVEGKLVLELKASDGVADIHLATLVSYLRIARLPLGILINFNVPVLRDGIYRRINVHALKATRRQPSATSASPSAPPRSPADPPTP